MEASAEERNRERSKDRKETRLFVAYFCIVCIPYYAVLIYCAYLLVDALP